tara:strand:- start:310 stop:579 length:270 start_codon:yes stop_codon:yes gene_type:complete
MHKVGSHPNAKIGDNRPDCGGGGRGEGNAKLVHIMFRTADDWSTDVLWRITNKPVAEWNLHLHKEWPNDPPKQDNSLVSQLRNISNVNS